MSRDDPEQVIRAYYRAHAGGEADAVCDLFTEDLLQRILVEELGGDSCEQAMMEGNLMHPEHRLDDAAALADLPFEVDVTGTLARVSIPDLQVEFRLALSLAEGTWRIAAFR